MWKESDYFKTLLDKDKQHYKSKLTLADNTQLPDPYTLTEDWKNDVLLMPDITYADIYNYLINTPSMYTKESLKSFRSLEGYIFFQERHVHDIFINHIQDNCDFCYIKSQVLNTGLFHLLKITNVNN
jgi:hypothetical protein